MSSRFILQRLIHSLIILWLVTVVVFLLLQLVPGDPALVMLGPQATPDDVTALRRSLGLDKPLAEQYVAYMARAVQGDLGTSIRAQVPVLQYVGRRIPATLQLLTVAILIAIAIGVPLGVTAAMRHRTTVDYSVITLSLLGQSIPSFWLGLMLIILLGVNLGLLPVAGRGSFSHLIMPSITLSFRLMGLLARLTRSSMLEVLSADYVRTARAKGLPQQVVVAKHALRNALIPIISVVGLQVAALLSGAVIVETIFSWPGIGSLAVNAIYQRDYPVVQAVVLLSALAFVLVNLLVDIGYVVLDPRIAYD